MVLPNFIIRTHDAKMKTEGLAVLFWANHWDERCNLLFIRRMRKSMRVTNTNLSYGFWFFTYDTSGFLKEIEGFDSLVFGYWVMRLSVRNRELMLSAYYYF